MSIADKIIRAKADYDEVYEAGVTFGFDYGETQGVQAGRIQGIEEGKQAEYDRFWDSYQAKGKRGYYTYMFAGQGWNDNTFKPKYDIRPTGNGARGIFRECVITDLRAILLACDVVLDFSGYSNNVEATFGYGKLTVLPKLDFSSATKLSSTFASATLLVEIEEMVVHENLAYSVPFNNCPSLEHLIVTGTIGQNGFDVSSCTKLSHDSLMSIINALKSGASNTITLGADNLAKLTDAEKAIGTEKGWTLI